MSNPPDLLAAAKELLSRGFEPIPVIGKDPKHLGKGWHQRRYHPDDNPSLYNGKVTGVGVMLGPSGLADLEADCIAAEVVLGILAPKTGLECEHAQRHHRFYRSDAANKAYDKPKGDQKPDEKPTLVEVRAGNNQSVVPPTIHKDGLPYRWVKFGEPASVDGEELHRVARLAAIAGTLALYWQSVARHHAALALAGFLRRRGVTVDEAVAVVTGIVRAAEDEESSNRIEAVRATYAKSDEAKTTGGNALVEHFGKDVVDHVSRLLNPPRSATAKAPTVDPAEVAESGEPTLTDTGNATRLAQAHGHRLRYATKLGWMIYDGTRFVPDEKRQVVEFAKATVRALYAEAAKEPDKAKRLQLVGWAQASESVTRIRAMIELAQPIPQIAVAAQELDSDPWLLNCQNGLLDLRTGKLHEHRPEQLLTLKTPVPYVPNAACPLWLRFLSEVMSGRQELIDYLQRWAGYALTGDVSEQSLLFGFGAGANGKSTFLDGLHAMMGEYATMAAPGLLLEQRNEQHATRIADLRGKRLVISAEVGQGKRLAEELVKQLTGEKVIKGRFMRQDFFSFPVQFKLFLAANYKPVIRGTDHAIWRRIPLVPFDVTFFDDALPRKDKKLPAKLLGELPGILAWAVRGFNEWHKRQLDPPQLVRAATERYRAEMDVLGVFLADRCHKSEGKYAVSADLYSNYKDWCVENGERVVRSIEFGERLREKGFTPERETINSKRVRVWWGLALGPNPDEAPTTSETPDSGSKLDGVKVSSRLSSGEPSSSPKTTSPGTTGQTSGHTGTHWDTISSIHPRVCVESTDNENGVPCVPVCPEHLTELPTRPFTFVNRTEQFPAMLEALKRAPVVGIDCETFGVGDKAALDPRRATVRLLQLATEEQTFIVDCLTVPLCTLFLELSTRTVVAHNAAFELSMLRPLGFTPGRVADTMLLSQLLHAGTSHKHTLLEVALRELGVTLDKEQQTSDWSGELTPEQLDYAARDAAILVPLYRRLMEQIEGEGLSRAADIELRCLPAIAWMGAAGVPVDARAWEELTAKNGEAVSKAEEQLRTLAPSHPDGKVWNWNSVAQTLEALDRVGVHLEKTSAEILKRVDHPLVNALLEYRKAKKRTSTYGKGWLSKNNQEGRVYPSWWQLGSVAGRMSCSNPNVQQIPRERDYRACFAAPPGRMLIKADYSQIEVRIAAVIANETVMLEAYRSGVDLHTRTARVVTGREEVTKEERQLAKTINFGLIYGMGADTLRSKLRKDYGIEISLEEAEAYRERFFTDYPALKRWHKSLPGNKSAVDTRTLTGRRRLGVAHFTFQANTPVQGTGADGLKQALVLLWERRSECPNAFPVIACHDEIVIECEMSEAEKAARWLKAAMVDGMAELIAPVPVEVETQIGRTWAG